MNIKNNIIDQLEKEADEFSYTLSIGLKSGEVVYIDGITKGEKNGYINFAKHSSETMILQIDNSLWRIGAEDIESINVRQSKKSTENVMKHFSNLFLSKSKFDKSSYIMWVKIFIFGAFVSLILAAAKTILAGDIMTMLMDPSLIKNVFSLTISYMNKAFILILIIEVCLFIIDLVLPSDEPFKKIKPYPDYASNTRLSNLTVIVVFAVIYKIVSTVLTNLS